MTAGNRYPTPVANANAEAECPDGNDSEVGIPTCRSSGTRAPSRSGRSLRPSRLAPWLTTALLTATQARPCAAARAPGRPPNTASRPAVAIQIPDLSAARDRRLIPASRAGVGVRAMAL